MAFSQGVTTPRPLWLAAVFGTVLALVCMLPPAPAAPLVPGGSSDFEFKRYCSNTLSDAIRLICGGRYNSLARKYPDSVGSGPYKPGPLKRLGPDDGIYYRPVPTGPIHECCRRPCGYSELKMYCAPD